jgi:FAD-dependent urate hydroxylase
VDILIAGAGIGGLALAHGLMADGHAVRMLEAGDRLRTGGAAVTIYSNGAAALAGLGAPMPEGLGGRIDLLEIRDRADRRVSRMDMSVMRNATGFAVTTVPRDRLIAHLAGGLPPDTIAFGRRVVRAEPTGSVFTADGTFTAEVVVGADGARSAVRTSVLGSPPAAELGWATWQGLTPVLPEIADGASGVLMVGDAGLVGMMPAGDGLTQWWFDVQGPVADGSVTEALRARFAGYAGAVPRLLESITDAQIACYPHVLHAVPDEWGAGRVTLLGDAAHAFPPSQAQGANQALEDAWLLRRALAGGGDPARRLREYERLRTPRVRRVSQLAASERTNRPANATAKFLARLVPAGIAGRGYVSLVRSFSSVLHDQQLSQPPSGPTTSNGVH